MGNRIVVDAQGGPHRLDHTSQQYALENLSIRSVPRFCARDRDRCDPGYRRPEVDEMFPTIQVWEDRLGQRDASRESGSHCDSSLEGMDSNFQFPKDGRTNSANNT